MLFLPGIALAVPLGKVRLSDFVADTVVINSIADSLPPVASASIKVRDHRPLEPNTLGIHQTKKFRYIPIDHYLTLQAPLATQLAQVMQRYGIEHPETLVVDYLSFWYDGHPAFEAACKLNGYSRLVDSSGKTIRDWQWELCQKPTKTLKADDCYTLLYNQWLSEQTMALKLAPTQGLPISPYRYRRQLMTWLDWIGLRDGYILIAHLTLDYPTDQLAKFVRGSPGIYYRRSSKHESIAIGGKDQQWCWRLNPRWLARANCTYRLGFNNFNPRVFSYVRFWNIMLINLSFSAGLEYRPIYLKGLYLGAGLHQVVNLLPTVIDRFDLGLMLTAGVVLP